MAPRWLSLAKNLVQHRAQPNWKSQELVQAAWHPPFGMAMLNPSL